MAHRGTDISLLGNSLCSCQSHSQILCVPYTPLPFSKIPHYNFAMKFLVVDDDQEVARAVKASLAAFSHAVDASTDGADGSFLARSYEYDAIVLDYSLPKKDGLAVCREVRSAGKTAPIIFLSNTADVDVKVAALEAGADDYMTKPFSLDELKARLEALTRRSPGIQRRSFSVADLILDPAANAVERGGEPIRLTKKEFCMLEYLVKNAGKIVSRPQIMEHVWTADDNPFSNTIEAHMRNLRKKLNAGGKPNLIANLPGRGYIIDAPERLARL